MKTCLEKLLSTRSILVLLFACYAVSPMALAVVPSPDGCYPNFTTAEGCNALNLLTSGAGNTGLGWYSLFSNSTGSFNTGVGVGALALNNADSNTAVGAAALFLNTSGIDNVAVGTAALGHNDTSFFNNAVGAFALNGNIDGASNNAFGEAALSSNTHASSNTAVGDITLEFNDSSGNQMANNNTAVGAAALQMNVDGSENTAVGTGAGPNVVTGLNNTYIGDFVGALAPDESSTIRIGDLSNGNGSGSLACFIGGIFNNPQPVGGTVVEVTLDLSTDKLGWDIGPSYKGGVASVQRGAPLPRSLPLPAVPRRQAMLNDKVEKLQATVAQQQKQIEALTAGLQKVSAELELNKTTPKTVLNNR